MGSVSSSREESFTDTGISMGLSSSRLASNALSEGLGLRTDVSDRQWSRKRRRRVKGYSRAYPLSSFLVYELWVCALCTVEQGCFFHHCSCGESACHRNPMIQIDPDRIQLMERNCVLGGTKT